MVQCPLQAPQLAACLSGHASSLTRSLCAPSPSGPRPLLFPASILDSFLDLWRSQSFSWFKCLPECHLLREDFPLFHPTPNLYPFPWLSEIYLLVYTLIYWLSAPLDLCRVEIFVLFTFVSLAPWAVQGFGRSWGLTFTAQKIGWCFWKSRWGVSTIPSTT